MNIPQKTKHSFFSVTAWYATFAPVAAAGLAFWITGNSFHTSDPKIYNVYYLGLLISLTSILASIVCLLGIHRHGWRVIVWKSIVGFCLGCLVLGWLVFLGFGQISN